MYCISKGHPWSTVLLPCTWDYSTKTTKLAKHAHRSQPHQHDGYHSLGATLTSIDDYTSNEFLSCGGPYYYVQDMLEGAHHQSTTQDSYYCRTPHALYCILNPCTSNNNFDSIFRQKPS
jgi:hypothetical protein